MTLITELQESVHAGYDTMLALRQFSHMRASPQSCCMTVYQTFLRRTALAWKFNNAVAVIILKKEPQYVTAVLFSFMCVCTQISVLLMVTVCYLLRECTNGVHTVSRHQCQREESETTVKNSPWVKCFCADLNILPYLRQIVICWSRWNLWAFPLDNFCCDCTKELCKEIKQGKTC